MEAEREQLLTLEMECVGRWVLTAKKGPGLQSSLLRKENPFLSLSFDFSFCNLKSGEEGTEL